MAADGVTLFARYAHAPNALGYCGPPAGMGAGEADVRAAARQFSGAWPYLQVLARLTGTVDPLDARLVEAYWLGRDLGVDRERFGAELLALIGPQAGRQWAHLGPELLGSSIDEVSADHGFHVFVVYPWSRLLGSAAGPALEVLDGCRIRCGLVVSADPLVVTSDRLTWDGTALGLAPAAPEEIAGSGPRPGDVVAVHWDRLADRLHAEQARVLQTSTRRRLATTNARLRARPCAGPAPVRASDGHR